MFCCLDGAAANERLGFLAHEIGNLISSAVLAVAALKRGSHPRRAGSVGGHRPRLALGRRGQPASERLLVHWPPRPRLAVGAGEHRPCLYRGPGPVRRAPPGTAAELFRRSCSAAPIGPAWASRSANTTSKPAVTSSVSATCLATAASSPPICRASRRRIVIPAAARVEGVGPGAAASG